MISKTNQIQNKKNQFLCVILATLFTIVQGNTISAQNYFSENDIGLIEDLPELNSNRTDTSLIGIISRNVTGYLNRSMQEMKIQIIKDLSATITMLPSFVLSEQMEKNSKLSEIIKEKSDSLSMLNKTISSLNPEIKEIKLQLKTLGEAKQALEAKLNTSSDDEKLKNKILLEKIMNESDYGNLATSNTDLKDKISAFNKQSDLLIECQKFLDEGVLLRKNYMILKAELENTSIDKNSFKKQSETSIILKERFKNFHLLAIDLKEIVIGLNTVLDKNVRTEELDFSSNKSGFLQYPYLMKEFEAAKKYPYTLKW